MIENLTISNFRAFRQQSFDFSKLNIFVGPNNSGKSSAISALNVLAQTIYNSSIGSSPIVLNDRFDQLGTFKDMVFGGRSNTPVKISFTIDEFTISIEIKYRMQRREIDIGRLKISNKNQILYEYISSKDKYDIYLGGKKLEDLGLALKKRRPRLNGFMPMSQSLFPYYISSPDEAEKVPNLTREIVRDVDKALMKVRRQVIETFRNFDSLGPFRVMPQRTYLYSGEVAAHIGRNGENTVALLSADSSKRGSERMRFIEEITKWMQVTDISAGINVKNLTDRHFELSVIGKDGVDHNICDVGFGCSQVLPVLVAGIKHINHKRSLAPPHSRNSRARDTFASQRTGVVRLIFCQYDQKRRASIH